MKSYNSFMTEKERMEIKFKMIDINYDEIYNRTTGEIRSKMVDIDYDEIWSRYKNESETFEYLYRIQNEESNVEITLYKWIFYLAYGDKCYNYTCNNETFEEAVRRIYEAVYRHTTIINSLNAINIGMTGSLIYKKLINKDSSKQKFYME